MGVEALGFDQAGAVETEPALATVLVCLLQDALLCPGGGGENPDFAVGEYTVHVEKDEFDFFGAGLGHGVAILAFESSRVIVCPDRDCPAIQSCRTLCSHAQPIPDMNAFCTIDSDPSYDYKAESRRSPGSDLR